MTFLSIIIVNWNTREFLNRCLRSVYETIQDLEFDVWVVDNASSDGSTVMVHGQFPDVHLIENPENLGFAQANNQALRLCDGQVVLLLNSDAFVNDNAVRSLVTVLESNLHAGIVGARLEYPDGRSQNCYWKLPTFASEVVRLSGLDKWMNPEGSTKYSESQAVKKVGAVSGACLLVRRAMLDEIGLFDERFFMFSEEIDLCKRAWFSGWHVLHNPAALVVHVNAGSNGGTAGRVVALYRAKLQYFTKHHGKFQAQLLYSAMRLLCFLKIFIYKARDQDRSRLWQEVSRELSHIFPSYVG
jgi:GT2 family glycosyltransferase